MDKSVCGSAAGGRRPDVDGVGVGLRSMPERAMPDLGTHDGTVEVESVAARIIREFKKGFLDQHQGVLPERFVIDAKMAAADGHRMRGRATADRHGAIFKIVKVTVFEETCGAVAALDSAADGFGVTHDEMGISAIGGDFAPHGRRIGAEETGGLSG